MTVPDREQLEHAITVLEAQRATLGDAVVDAAIEALRQRTARARQPVAVEQHRQITVLFVDMVGSTAMAERLDPEDVSNVMRAYRARLDGAIARYGGVREKYIGDAVKAVFGVPTAHEHAPEHAVLAALAMRQSLESLNADLERQYGVRVGLRIGINTGQALVSFLEDGSGDPATVGDMVNLAARLEQNAPAGGILISHDTYRHLGDTFEVEKLEPLNVKGKRKPVQPYLVRAQRPRAQRPPAHTLEGIGTPLLGRDAELARLRAALGAPAGGRASQLITVVGAAGIGKSRLVAEWLDEAQRHPSRPLLFTCRADERTSNLPYALVRDLFALHFEILDSDPPAVARQKLQAGFAPVLGAAAEAQVPFIGQLIGFDFTASPALGGVLGDARQIRNRAFGYLAQFCDALARRRPLVFVLEDIHWADEGSLNLVEHLAQECRDAPLLIVCAARPSLYERRPQWGRASPNAARLDLHPLADSTARQLVAQLLSKAAAVPPALYDLVVGQAEGNAFYAVELVKVLIEDGVIDTSGEPWQIQADRLVTTRVPPTLTGVLQARIDTLPQPERATIERAAVVGRLFWDKAVEQLDEAQPAPAGDGRSTVMVQGASQNAERLASLRAKGLIALRDASSFAGAQEYSFSHAILHQVTYDRMLRRQRRAYHAKVAAWLIDQAGARVVEYSGLIGEHYDQAGEPLHALEWYRQAARHAQSAGALETAALYYQRVLDLLPDTADLGQTMRRAEAFEGLGEILVAQGRFAQAEHKYAEMHAAAAGVGDELAQARALYGLAEVQESQGNYHQALASAQQVEELALAAGGQLELVAAMQIRAWCLFKLGEVEAGHALAEQALLLAIEADAPREQARTMNLLATIYTAQGQLSRAAQQIAGALALYRELGDQQREAGTLVMSGVSAEARGDNRGAAAAYAEALAATGRLGGSAREAGLLVSLGRALLRSGDDVSAAIYLRQAIEQAEGGDRGLALAHSLLAETRLAQGHMADALALGWQGLKLAHKSLHQPAIAAAWRSLGVVATRVTRDELNARPPRGEPAEQPPPTLRQPEQCFTESVRIYNDLGMEAERARTLRIWAQHAARRGNQAQAQALWQIALDIFTREGLSLEVERMAGSSYKTGSLS